MGDALDKELRHAAATAAEYCEPELHVISFHYSPLTRWMCIIQESRFIEAAMGLGAEPSEAFWAAIRDLVTRRNKEANNENQG